MFNKVFCVGFNKTGTSTLHQLFLDLGLTSWHGYYSHIPVGDPLFAAYQCFSDGNEHDFELLDQTFPGSRFIATSRRLDDWLVSRIRHVEQRRLIGATGPMRQEYEADPVAAVGRWVSTRRDYHQRLAAYFAARPGDLLAIDLCRGTDPDGVLAATTRFLDITPPPGLRLPHENAGRSPEAAVAGVLRTKAEVRAEVLTRLGELGLSEAEQRSVFP